MLVRVVLTAIRVIEIREIIPASVEYEMHILLATRLDKTRQSPSANWKRPFIAQIGGDCVPDPGIVVRQGLPDRHAASNPWKRMEKSLSRSAG
jgi:hypothetical protein